MERTQQVFAALAIGCCPAVDDTLVAIAARKLIESLSSQGFDPFTWKREHLRPFEIGALEAYARQRLAADPTLSRETNLAQLALVALAEDWSMAMSLASEAARQGRVNDPPEVRGFVMNAPPSDVIGWLQHGLPVEMPSYVAGSILDAVAKRNEPSITFQTLDELRLGRLGRDAQSFDLRVTCDAHQLVCAEQANTMLIQWLHDDNPIPVGALGLLFTWAAPERLSADDWSEIEMRLLQILADRKFTEIYPALIGFLARSKSVAARTALKNRIQEHVEGSISFGFAERRALLDALPQLAVVKPDAVALAIAKRSATEAASLRESQFAPSDGTVQDAYLRLLSKGPLTDWARHRDWVGKLLERRLRGDFPFQRLDIDRAFAALLARLDALMFLKLFGQSVPPVVDTIDARLSTRRAYLLGLLTEDRTLLPQLIVEAICSTIPALEANRPSFYRILALRGGETGRACLRVQLAADGEAIEFVGLAGDLDALVEMLQRAGSAQPSVDLQKLLSAAQKMVPAQQREFITAALRQLPEVNRASLWPVAASIKLVNPGLVEAAVAEIAVSASPEKLAAAIDYLNHVAPDRVRRTLSLPEASKRFEALMNQIEAFDWIRVAQILPEVESGSDASALKPSLVRRRFLLVLDAEQVAPPAKLPDRLMSVRSKLVGNPLWRLMVLRGGERAAAALLQSRSAMTDPVDTLGSLPEAKSVYRSYMGWLLAEVSLPWDPQLEG